MNLALAFFYNVAADRKSEAGTAALGCEVWSEQIVDMLFRNSRTIVIERDVVISLHSAVSQTDEYTSLSRLPTGFNIFLLLVLHCLNGICDQIYEYSDLLWLRSHHISIRHAHISDSDILLVVEYQKLVLQDLVKVHQHRFLGI